jgi:hypothetical protein
MGFGRHIKVSIRKYIEDTCMDIRRNMHGVDRVL